MEIDFNFINTKKNYIYLCVCKTGCQTFIQEIKNKHKKNPSFNERRINHYWHYWQFDNSLIHKIYYFNPETKEYLDKIKNKSYILVIRDPLKRFKSCYNFCSFNRWFKGNLKEYMNYYKETNKEINIFDKFKNLADKDKSLLEHSRGQFELFKLLKITIYDIKFILKTETINKDISLLLYNIFSAKKTKNPRGLILNRTTYTQRLLNKFDKYSDEINILLKDEFKIYNLLLESIQYSSFSMRKVPGLFPVSLL